MSKSFHSVKVNDNVGGLPVNIYTDQTADKSLPVAVLFFLHGRGETALAQESTIENVMSLIHRYAEKAQASRDLMIVSFDQRNHGHRMVSVDANHSWNTTPKPGRIHNERHAYDMYSIQNGTARDVSFLIDFLPAYLFPDGSRVIKDWLVAGVSLGGHSTWMVLKNEPRVKIGIPIIGCPDYLTLMESRAKQEGLELVPPLMPDSLKEYIKKTDPCGGNEGFEGKRILVIAGAEDKLVPYSASESFVTSLDVGKDGVKQVIVEEGVGHAYPPSMQEALAKFVWDQCVRAENGSPKL